MGNLGIKRIYEAPAETDGSRILVDRLWPRGIKKENAALTEWVKTIAPTNELRKAFGHDPELWPDFQVKYRAELDANPDAAAFAAKVQEMLKAGNVTLLFGAKDTARNNAVVLKEWLEEK